MPRLRRWTLNAVTAVSLLLCVASAGLWARSYRFTDRVHWAHAGGWRAVGTARGFVEIGLLRTDWSASPQEFHPPRYTRETARSPVKWILLLGGSSGDVFWSAEHAGFAWQELRNRSRGTLHAFAIVPFWSLVAVTAALPVARVGLWRRRARRRTRTGRCQSCGYDLTGNESGVCPECGTAIDPPPPSANPARRP